MTELITLPNGATVAELADGSTVVSMPDGSTVITVLGRTWRGQRRTIGVFSSTDGESRWIPAVDANTMAAIGTATGFVAALIGTLAVLKRPPWPDLSPRRGSDRPK